MLAISGRKSRPGCPAAVASASSGVGPSPPAVVAGAPVATSSTVVAGAGSGARSDAVATRTSNAPSATTVHPRSAAGHPRGTMRGYYHRPVVSAAMAIPRSQRGRARLTFDRLAVEYPGTAKQLCALRHENPFQLLTATILSAQTTDERVNMVTPALFAKYPTPADLAVAD